MSKIVHESGIERSAFEILVWELNGKILDNPIDMYVSADDAESTAIRLSKVIPDATIALCKMSRHKARYKNGERIFLMNYHEYYSNLTDEQYASTLIRGKDGSMI